MVIKKSMLAAFVTDCIQQIQAGRADALNLGIQTDPFEVSFSVDVIDDSLPAIEGDSTEQRQPETKQVAEKAASKSVQVQNRGSTRSEENQTSTPGVETTTQEFGRGSNTDVSYVE